MQTLAGVKDEGIERVASGAAPGTIVLVVLSTTVLSTADTAAR
jgi:hypothetical protein